MTVEKPRPSAHRPDQAIPVVVACLVATLGASDPTFRSRFLDNLSETFRATRNSASRDCLDMLSAVRAALQADEASHTT